MRALKFKREDFWSNRTSVLAMALLGLLESARVTLQA
jgi:hypothetical protein